jgi:hypothetical protein
MNDLEKVDGAASDDSDIFAGIAAERATDAEQAILRAPIPIDDLDILPTGEIYLPQVHYRRILTDAFGVMGWALRPMSPVLLRADLMCREYALVVHGRYAAAAIGECTYDEKNLRMTYATAAEAVKSNALMRCCKDLGIAACCWDRRFIEAFKRDHCETYRDPHGKERWRRKLAFNPDQRADEPARQALFKTAVERFGNRAEASRWIEQQMADLRIGKGEMTYAQCEQLTRRLGDGGLA